MNKFELVMQENESSLNMQFCLIVSLRSIHVQNKIKWPNLNFLYSTQLVYIANSLFTSLMCTNAFMHMCIRPDLCLLHMCAPSLATRPSLCLLLSELFINFSLAHSKVMTKSSFFWINYLLVNTLLWNF